MSDLLFYLICVLSMGTIAAGMFVLGNALGGTTGIEGAEVVSIVILGSLHWVVLRAMFRGVK